MKERAFIKKNCAGKDEDDFVVSIGIKEMFDLSFQKIDIDGKLFCIILQVI